MKKMFYGLLLVGSFSMMSSCGESTPPSICDCLTTGGSLPSGCEQVFKNRYGTTDPSSNQMRNDYDNCKNR